MQWAGVQTGNRYCYDGCNDRKVTNKLPTQNLCHAEFQWFHSYYWEQAIPFLRYRLFAHVRRIFTILAWNEPRIFTLKSAFCIRKHGERGRFRRERILFHRWSELFPRSRTLKFGEFSGCVCRLICQRYRLPLKIISMSLSFTWTGAPSCRTNTGFLRSGHLALITGNRFSTIMFLYTSLSTFTTLVSSAPRCLCFELRCAGTSSVNAQNSILPSNNTVPSWSNFGHATAHKNITLVIHLLLCTLPAGMYSAGASMALSFPYFI